MALDLADYENTARDAVRMFWRSRESALKKQIGDQYVGERSAVTAGKNMDGFVHLVEEVVKANGVARASIHKVQALLTLPGYFRPAKQWDLLVVNEGRLVAAIELKSQAGPSFGNNFNNRAEEAIGSACDLWAAYREGAFGDQPGPFVGWLVLVEDELSSRKPVQIRTPHFPPFSVFQGASYLERYDLLCRRLMSEQMYTAAAVISTPRSAVKTGEYGTLSQVTGLRAFVIALAAHIAAESAAAKLR